MSHELLWLRILELPWNDYWIPISMTSCHRFSWESNLYWYLSNNSITWAGLSESHPRNSESLTISIILIHILAQIIFHWASLITQFLTCNAGDPGSIPGSGRSAGEGIGYPFQYSWASLLAQLIKNPCAMWETCFDPWVGKIPWRRKRLPTPVFWPGEFHGLYSPWSCKGLDTTEGLSLSHLPLQHFLQFMSPVLALCSHPEIPWCLLHTSLMTSTSLHVTQSPFLDNEPIGGRDCLVPVVGNSWYLINIC